MKKMVVVGGGQEVPLCCFDLSSYLAMPVADRRQNPCACGEGPVSAQKIRVPSNKVDNFFFQNLKIKGAEKYV